MTRSGQISGTLLAFLGSVVVLGVLILPLVWDPAYWSSAKVEPIVVYCAAGIRKPVEAAAQDYEKAHGVPVHLQYGPSQTLLANIEVSKTGDLYLPADDSYLDLARGKELIDESIPLAKMKPVLAVARGNPKGIRSLDDVCKEGIRFAQSDPDAAAVGKLTRDALRKAGRWNDLKKHTAVFKLTVTDVANDIKAGAVDAGIVWDAVVRQYPELEAVPTPELEDTTAQVTIAVLRCGKQPTAALKFARFLAASDRGLIEFEKQGYEPVDGDVWAEVPEIHLSAGAMLRPAIEDTVTAFSEREGARIIRVYDGCGILVSAMRTGKHPDAYFSCDSSFMLQVKDLFLDSVDISTNQLVIIVPKKNPFNVRSLDDLGKQGLRIGVGHEKQCALGVLTQRALQESGKFNTVMKNVKVQKPTGDGLVNDLRIGALDAVIAYVSNAASNADELLAIPVDVPCGLAVQPFAIGKESRHKHLTQRLLDAIRSAESKRRFEENGFRWQPSEPK